MEASRGPFAGFMPRSIVARTSLLILLLAVIMGLLFSFVTSWRERATEHGRLLARVTELAATVESTVSIACFLNDATLAKEIAAGLMKNRIVAGVSITSGATMLHSASDKSRGGGSARIEALTSTIYSPFDRERPLGEITLYVSHAEIEAQSSATSTVRSVMMAPQKLKRRAVTAFIGASRPAASAGTAAPRPRPPA
jgi:hypothetical protein